MFHSGKYSASYIQDVHRNTLHFHVNCLLTKIGMNQYALVKLTISFHENQSHSSCYCMRSDVLYRANRHIFAALPCEHTTNVAFIEQVELHKYMQNATWCECVKITVYFNDIQDNVAMESSSPTSLATIILTLT